MRISHHRIYMSDAYCILVDHYSRVESVILPFSFLVVSSIFQPWCVLFPTGVDHRTGAKPRPCGEANGLTKALAICTCLVNHDFPQWTARSMFFYNVFSLCQIEQTMNAEPCSLKHVQASLNIPTFQDDTIPTVGHIGCVNALTKQPEPLDWETYLALPTCKSRTAPITVLETSSALRPCKLHRWNELLCTNDLQLHQMTTEPSQPLRISRYIERHTFAHLRHDNPN